MPAINVIQKHEQKALTSSASSFCTIPPNGKILSIQAHFLTSAGATVTEAQVRAEISNMRLTIGGRDVVNTSPTIILDVYEHLGTRVGNNTAPVGVVELDLARLFFFDPAVRDSLGYGTFDVSSIQLQVLAGTLSAIASVETYTERVSSTEVLGTYGTLLNYPKTFNATGQDTIDTLPKNASTTYVAAFIQTGASGVIFDSEVRYTNQLGTQTARERVPLQVNRQSMSNNGFQQPSGYYTHLFTDGQFVKRLPMAGTTDFRLITNFTTAPGAGGYGVAMLALENVPAALP